VSRALFAVLAGLGLPGLLPALAVARSWAVAVFLAPLIGAGLAAVAAEPELGVGGSFVPWYLLAAAMANAAVVAWWFIAPRRSPSPAGPPWTWSIVMVAVLLGAMAVPLIGLRTGIIGYDGNVIWLTHTSLVSGGHRELLAGLQNAAYRFSNPDYPPLVPAAGALALALAGHNDLRVAVQVTAFLNATALGVVGAGVAAVASKGRALPRMAAVAAAGVVCLVGFSVTECYYSVGGYADLLWSAAAMGAVVWGLVLPRNTQSLAVAWICAAVATLTKNEGLAVGLVLLVLIALRYRPLTRLWPRIRPRSGRLGAPAGRAGPDPARRRGVAVWPAARTWAVRAAFVVVPALPGLAWAALVRAIGVRDAFFASASAESPGSRAAATASAMAVHLAVAPVGLAVLVVGCVFLRRSRRHAGLANPAWLWTAGVLSLAIIFATYVFGSYEIHWWLLTSVNRTTIFAQVAVYTDLAIWMVIAFGGGAARAVRDRPEPAPVTARTH